MEYIVREFAHRKCFQCGVLVQNTKDARLVEVKDFKTGSAELSYFLLCKDC